MIILILLLYGLPVYLVFFRYKLVLLTTFWKVFLWIPPVVTLLFLWFALGRYTPLAQMAYVQAPVVQIAPEVGGLVTALSVQDNQEVKRGAPLFQIDKRPFQYRVDQAKAKLTEVQERALAIQADVYATDEAVGEAEANLRVAKQNLAAAIQDLESARNVTREAVKQLDLAEKASSRNSLLIAKQSISQQEYEDSLRDVATQRSNLIGAQSSERRAETATEVSSLRLDAAESLLRESRALRGKAEVLVDPVKTLRRVVEYRNAVLQGMKQEQPNSNTDLQAQSVKVQDMEAELDRLQRYLSKAIPIDPLNQDVQPTVRQSIEDLNAAQWALERTTVLTPTNGIVANLQLTEGCYAKAGTPVATVIDTTRWRLIAAVPENWLEKVRPGDDVYYSLRNYPGRVRTAKVEYVGRGVLQGQGVPSGNLPDTDPRQTRQPDTPQPEQEFQVIIQLEDSLPDQPLRVGMTGRVTIFAGGGFPIVNQLAPILHTVLSCFDFLHPKPSPTVALLGVTAIVGGVIWRRAYANRMNRS